jgi:S1-C subfamily serine protease
VRSGCIARIRDALAASSKELLIDAPIFPGNSGGPVVTKPEEVAIQGTKAVGSAYLIGMVTSYVPYRDVAVSAQTGAVRIVFEENSGLASVLPMDYVVEAIQTRLGK